MKKYISILLIFTFFLLLAGAASFNYMSAVTDKIGVANAIFSVVFVAMLAVIITFAVRFEVFSALTVVSVYCTALSTLSFLLLYANIFFYDTIYAAMFARVMNNFTVAVIFTPYIGFGVLSSNRLLSSAFIISCVITAYSLGGAAYLAGKRRRKIAVMCSMAVLIATAVTFGAGRFAADLNAFAADGLYPDFSITSMILTALYIVLWIAATLAAYRLEAHRSLVLAAVFNAAVTAVSVALVANGVELLSSERSFLLTLPATLLMSGYSGAQNFMIPVSLCSSAALLVFAVICLTHLNSKRRGYLLAE